jgi:hypothetical protein
MPTPPPFMTRPPNMFQTTQFGGDGNDMNGATAGNNNSNMMANIQNAFQQLFTSLQTALKNMFNNRDGNGNNNDQG